jgi:hypothetical protein
MTPVSSFHPGGWLQPEKQVGLIGVMGREPGTEDGDNNGRYYNYRCKNRQMVTKKISNVYGEK